MASLPWSSSRPEARRTARAPAVLLTSAPGDAGWAQSEGPACAETADAILIELAARGSVPGPGIPRRYRGQRCPGPDPGRATLAGRAPAPAHAPRDMRFAKADPTSKVPSARWLAANRPRPGSIRAGAPPARESLHILAAAARRFSAARASPSRRP